MKSLELRIPPPAQAMALALAMWLISWRTDPLAAPFGFRLGAALALVALGQGISIAGIVAFRRASTTVNPFKPGTTSSLVTAGIYRFTRNPMYVGLLLMLVAWAVFLASPPALIGAVTFVLSMNRLQIEPEERALTMLFGDAYVGYKARVRRWV